jgi:hypothetical protein
MDARPQPVARSRALVATQAICLALPLALGFLLRYPSLFEPRWYGDEGIFAAVAGNLRHGRMLYSGAWDNKPPLIFFTYAGIQSLFGNGVFALHLVATAWVLATQAVVMVLAAMILGWRRAVVAGVAFALIECTPVIEGNLAMTETFMILPASLAVLLSLVAERREPARRMPYYAAAGLMIGIAASYKQVAIFDGAAIGVAIWLTHAKPMRALVPMAAGFAVPQLAFAVLFLATGAFPQYWYAVVGSLGLYASLADENPAAKFAGLLPALLATAWLVRRRQRGEPIPAAAFPCLWLGFAIGGTTSSAFPFPHYLQQAAPAAALTIAAAPFSFEREPVGRVTIAVGVVLVASVIYGQFAFALQDRDQLHPVAYYRTFLSHRYGTMSDLDYDYYFSGKTVAVDDIVGRIERDGRGGTMFTWSELPWMYAGGDFQNPTRYYTSFLGDLIPGARAEILRDLGAKPPAYIVTSDESYAPFEELDVFIASRYTLLDARNDWRIYRRTDAAGEASSLRGRGRD